jgi:epoxyqueuosine reductase
LRYSKEVAAAIQPAQYIRNLGYEAVASVNDKALCIPYAIKAGLGEYGRNQMVITPEFGPRLRFSKVFTNLPLGHDVPRKNGVKEFCDICDRFAKACPPKALPFGSPEEGGDNISTIKGVKKWSANGEKCFNYWVKLQTDCAICLRVCPYNRDYSKPSARLFGKFAGTRLCNIVKWLDDKFSNYECLKPKDWWTQK